LVESRPVGTDLGICTNSKEHWFDLEAARAALREDPQGIPWATVKKRLGL